MLVDWLNQNQGVLTLIIFVATCIFAWFSGIVSALRRRPVFAVDLLNGPTFCCKFDIGKKHDNGYPFYRVGFALYMRVINRGAAPSSIESISIAYKWHVKPFTVAWLRYRLGYFWLHEQTIALEDFQVDIGDSIKFYPFLFQRSSIAQNSVSTYLDIGRSVNGVVYFEQSDSWGGAFPSPRNGCVFIKIHVTDSFGGVHKSKHRIPDVNISDAMAYNPSFGKTLAALQSE
ncbi:conserved hypothetical protein [Brucella sp. 83/13]|nr:conserved hypothetical protein [Brucella sp. 83/13]